MDFTFPKHNTTGVLNGDDLVFFYYDISLDHLQGLPEVYDWDSVVAEFKDVLDIDSCKASGIPSDFEINKIRFTVSYDKDMDNGSKSAAFFRHLRNGFSHYKIIREGENYVLTDGEDYVNMRGLVNAELLKNFCFKLFDTRDKVISNHDNANNPTL